MVVPSSSPAAAIENGNPTPMQVRVRSVTPHGPEIRCYEVVDPAGGPLPPFEPGSHIDVRVPGGNLGVRQYSLCGDPHDRSHYLFAVQREAAGRGGSKAIFDMVRPSTALTISPPRNHFALRPAATYHLLLAGGIGVTPMISMLHYLRRHGSGFTLHYCSRSTEQTAFLDFLQPLAAEGGVRLHCDGGDPSQGLDVTALLKDCPEGTHLYYCGPPGFMSAVAAASAHWPMGTTHREFFRPSAHDLGFVTAGEAGESNSDAGFGPPFQVKIASTGQIFHIPSDRSVLSVLRDHGFEIETQCELGVCGSCRTGYLDGAPDHRDFVLERDEQARDLTVCCSRSKSALLVLDL